MDWTCHTTFTYILYWLLGKLTSKRASWNYAKLALWASAFQNRMTIPEQAKVNVLENWAASSEFGTYRQCEQRRFRRACASAQSRQNRRCSLIQAVSQEEPSDRKPDPWPLWMAGHAQLKFVMTECSKTQIRLTGLNYVWSLLLHKDILWCNKTSKGWRKQFFFSSVPIITGAEKHVTWERFHGFWSHKIMFANVHITDDHVRFCDCPGMLIGKTAKSLYKAMLGFQRNALCYKRTVL